MPAHDPREEAVLARIEEFRRRRPRLAEDRIDLSHGAGGKATAALVEVIFREAFANPQLDRLADAAVGDVPAGHRVALTTDAHVVTPRRFPGGSLGSLAVHGTVNDLAVMGAIPAWLSAGFVLEEGLLIEDLRGQVADMAAAAGEVGVAVVAGDTKVVPRGMADGLYVVTAGLGWVPAGRSLGPEHVQPGDAVVVSGWLGDHGIAVLLARGELALDADVRSDTAPVTALTEALLAAVPATRWMRDPTRGGLATACNELAVAAGVGIVLDELALPVRDQVRGACELLGLDPLHVANEGKVLAVVPGDEADAAVAALRAVPGGEAATVVGRVVEDPPRLVVLETTFGATRVLDVLVGDPLPRIC